MFRHHLPPVINANGEGVRIECNLDYEKLADITEGYSGSDIQLVCKEAAMRRVRSIFNILEEANPENPGRILQIQPVTTIDVECALSSTKPSSRTLAPKYLDWQRQYESS